NPRADVILDAQKKLERLARYLLAKSWQFFSQALPLYRMATYSGWLQINPAYFGGLLWSVVYYYARIIGIMQPDLLNMDEIPFKTKEGIVLGEEFTALVEPD
ncbi:unnamed protein product, partial [marine sediment metagenome]